MGGNIFTRKQTSNIKRTPRQINTSENMKRTLAQPYVTILSKKPITDPKTIMHTIPKVKVQDRPLLRTSYRKGNKSCYGSLCFYTS